MDTETERHRANPFKSLLELTNADLDVEQRIRRAIDVGCEFLGVDNGVLSYTGDGEYEIMQTNVESGPYVDGAVLDLEETWCRHVVRTGESVGFADAADSPFRDDHVLNATGLHCYVGAAVDVDGETYGTLCFSSEEPRAESITDAEIDFISVLAEWVGAELERRKHDAELRRQNERLEEFTGIVAHDLRNPLAGAIGFTELAQDKATGEVAEFLERVRNSLGRMESMIAECLILAKEGADLGKKTPVDLADLVRDAWDTVRTRNATLTVDIEPETIIIADEMSLQRLFENLFRNSVEHGPTGSRTQSGDSVEHGGAGVSVTVTGDASGFVVADDGPGLPPAVQAALTDGNTENLRAFGLGLLVVERVVSGHGWDLTVDTSADGTRFDVTGVDAAEPARNEPNDAVEPVPHESDDD